MEEHKDFLKHRLQKLNELRDAGVNPYANTFKVAHTTTDIAAGFNSKTKEEFFNLYNKFIQTSVPPVMMLPPPIEQKQCELREFANRDELRRNPSEWEHCVKQLMYPNIPEVRDCFNRFQRMPQYSGCNRNQLTPLILKCITEFAPQLQQKIDLCLKQTNPAMVLPIQTSLPFPQSMPAQPPVLSVMPRPMPVQSQVSPPKSVCNGCEIKNQCVAVSIRLVNEKNARKFRKKKEKEEEMDQVLRKDL